MCGIAGWFHSLKSKVAREKLVLMADSLAHRGPDGRGVYYEQVGSVAEVGLAHRRLAIIDLSTGDQPMFSPCGKYSIVFNGEIYNFLDLRKELEGHGHSFVTRSDTEVLLHSYMQWGYGCLSRLRGMFAFALWDSNNQQLFLARDRYGKKPLYLWHNSNGDVAFASEIKALLKYPQTEADLDRASVMDYLQYRYVPSPATLFKNIKKLSPGHYAVVSAKNIQVQRYYTPPDAFPRNGKVFTRQEALARFAALFEESVRIRMVSDVPYGAFLSGGLDSSAVVAMMARHSSRPILTFSMGFEEDVYDESAYSNLIAGQYKTNHHSYTMPSMDVINLLPKAITFRDAPIAEPTDIAVMKLSMHAAGKVKMVLTGEGADEILGGYPKHKYEPYAALYQKFVPDFLHHAILKPLADRIGWHNVVTVITCLGIRDAEERMPRWFGALTAKESDELMAIACDHREVSKLAFSYAVGNSALRKVLYFDQASWLPDNLLERGDSMMMAASLEGRMPFMDHALAEFVSSCPDDYRIYHGVQKWLLRKSMKAILPDSVISRPKIGFKVPVRIWFRSSLRDFVRGHLQGSSSITRGYYKPEKIEAYLTEHEEGRRNHEKLIWALLNLELFQKQYQSYFSGANGHNLAA